MSAEAGSRRLHALCFLLRSFAAADPDMPRCELPAFRLTVRRLLRRRRISSIGELRVAYRHAAIGRIAEPVERRSVLLARPLLLGDPRF